MISADSAIGSERRSVARLVRPQPTMEGAGVALHRSIATRELNYLDPFLLFDDFSSDNPDDYLAGFPLHPHRGIETVTYMLEGYVSHRDTLGNAGTIGPGDVQWMTAGRGIMHEEMPQQRGRRMTGFQLWVNLPARNKMMAPRYQEIAAARIPEVVRENGVRIRVVTGTVDGFSGPVTDIVVNPLYLDIQLPPATTFEHPVTRGHSAFAYLFEGACTFAETGAAARSLVVFDDGDFVHAHTAQEPARFLLIAGQPLREPIARYGPFVMNTQEEIRQTLRELQEGTFIKAS